MSRVLTDQARAVLRAPLAVPVPVETLGGALWLYVALVVAAHESGLVIRRRDLLARDLGVEASRIDEWIDALVRAKLVHPLSRPPFLTVRLSAWPGSSSVQAEKAAAGQAEQANAISNVPVSSSRCSSRSHQASGG